ncbi:LuxR C-terminal-related transcriptional regulator [Actinopolyspora sp. H202]|uniref:response regulator transcription factor n=1 Tax=Actinopolyspora sp. H202 TaxID=1500456 RepID=UPI003EE587D6
MIVLIDRQGDIPAISLNERIRTTVGIERVEYPDAHEDFLAKAERLRPRIGVVSADRADLDIERFTERVPGWNETGGLIVIASSEERQAAGFALRCGARGALSSESTEEEIIAALFSVRVGHPFAPPKLVTDMHSMVGTLLCAPERTNTGCSLTEREWEVLKLLAFGHSNEGIAGQLCISTATVRSHVLHILRKMRVRNRSQAVAIAYGLYSTIPHEPTSPLDAQAV